MIRRTTHFARPDGARGILPLILAAIGGARLASGIYGAVSGNQQKQRTKGYINDAYRTAKTRMGDEQNEGLEGSAEALSARGLAPQPGSQIRAAMLNGTSTATTLGGQTQSNLLREYGLDRHALTSARDQALNENNANALNTEIGSVAGGIGGAAQMFGAAQDNAAFRTETATGGAKMPGASSTLSGPDTIRGAFGVSPIDPLGDPSSTWHPANQSRIAAGEANATFNTGMG